ncbi:c-type cytochrome [Undibacterium sp.]|uniref:c-type cytochrome n=1 Tax=Undibacterium sp. TaxID=1914977 RepID=UPI00374DC89A
MKTKKIALVLAGALLGGAALTAAAANGQDMLKQQCIACHAVAKPDKATLDRLWERKGPDLHYAGDKFNREWLVAWLQNPSTIRPGGVMFAKLAKPSADKTADQIDAAQLAPHPKLSKDDAAAVADSLMALKVDGLVEKGGFKNEPVNASFASMLFSKLRGCTSCHAAKPGTGGQSGPELYSAGERLQPDFVAAFIKDPQKFTPHVWMPKLDLNEADVQKLTGYIATMKPGEKK